MTNACPRCRRTNPREAAFCYFDGAALQPGSPQQAAALQLPREFAFPSGRRCRSFDTLVEGCYYEWEDARVLLRRGDFTRFLGLIGRVDLARAAQEALRLTDDDDLALHHFLANLPVGHVKGPRLDLQPRRLILGALRPGESRLAQLTLSNTGKGLLQGKVTVSDGQEWLRVAEGHDGTTAEIKAAKQQQINLRIDPAPGLTAPHSYTGTLTVITNGGVSEVPVSLDLRPHPFPLPPFQGATTPRELAERMRSIPKQAVPLLEKGEISRWFQRNGWNYPVSGVTAPGVAAVQQFFEGMGLSKPPPVQLTRSELSYTITSPKPVLGEVTLRTPARKWVFAQADSDVPWIRVRTPNVSGPQETTLAFEIDPTLVEPDHVHEGRLTVLANAGQRLALRIRADVRRPHEPFARRLLRPFFVGALIALVGRLLLAVPADLFARLLAPHESWPAAGTFAGWAWAPSHPQDLAHFLEVFVLSLAWLGAPLGVALAWKKGDPLDRAFAALAGAVFGLFGAATLGCLLLVGDALPRAVFSLLGGLAGFVSSPWLWTPVWLVLACACWAFLGGGVGLLLCGIGRAGARWLTRAASPFRWLCRLCGLGRAADFFVLEG
jgi:hypothetical protein